MTTDRSKIRYRFLVHPSSPDEVKRFAARLEEAAMTAVDVLPQGRELSLVLKHLQDANFWAIEANSTVPF